MTGAEREHLLERLRTDAARIADHFGLRFKAIEAEHWRVKSRYGACYDDGLIKIRLNHAKTGKPLKYSSMIDTLCHELAHLQHFNHGPEFEALFWKLLGWARAEGIYRPSPRRAKGQAAAAAAAQQVATRPVSLRNGVPVFAAPTPTGPLPWERMPWLKDDAQPAQSKRQRAAAPSSPAKARPRRAAKTETSEPTRQLSLFD